MATTCPACGAANDSDDRYCGDCGAVIGGEAPPVAGSGTVPSHPADARAPSAHAAPATERRLVSILFVDLVGFTTLADDSDPEAVREFLGRYFELAREVVERYGGSIEKFIGDAVMAVWGTPFAREDDAERSVRAALDLVAAIPGLGTDRPQARAAVLTGEAAAVIGAQGQGMVAGDLVNTASRLQSAAPPGTVLVGDATQRAAGEAIVFETRRRAAPARQDGPGARVAGRPGRRRAAWGGAQQPGRAAVRGSRRGAAAPAGSPARHHARRARPAGLGRRDRRHREEPARVGAGEVRRRRRGRHLLASRPLSGVRRGAGVLGAGRDGPRTCPDRRER